MVRVKINSIPDVGFGVSQILPGANDFCIMSCEKARHLFYWNNLKFISTLPCSRAWRTCSLMRFKIEKLQIVLAKSFRAPVESIATNSFREESLSPDDPLLCTLLINALKKVATANKLDLNLYGRHQQSGRITFSEMTIRLTSPAIATNHVQKRKSKKTDD